VLVPLVATIWVLVFIYRFISGRTEPLVVRVVTAYHDHIPSFLLAVGPREETFTIPGVSFALTILLVIVVGLLVTNVFGRRIVHGLEGLLERVPLVNVIYSLVKQVTDSLQTISESSEQLEEKNARDTVYIRYPGVNGYLIAFQTGAFKSKDGRKLVSVFLPTAPNPITGFVLVFEADQVIPSDLTMEEAWKLLVSAGFVTPRQLTGKTTTTVPDLGQVDTTQTA
jgi:uncharacterized membrane protein